MGKTRNTGEIGNKILVDTDVTITTLAGTGTRMVVADPTGLLGSGDLTGYTTNTGAQNLINKRITPRTTVTSSSSTPTPDISTTDLYILSALAVNATFGAPTGNPVAGEKLMIRIKDNGTARTLGYNAIYRAIGITLPTTTVINKTLYLGMIYNNIDTKWDVIAVAQES